MHLSTKASSLPLNNNTKVATVIDTRITTIFFPSYLGSVKEILYKFLLETFSK